MENDVYVECPVYKSTDLMIRLIREDDAQDLLRCYSDDEAIPLFNSDNCHGNKFVYKTFERMKAGIYFWLFCYEKRCFVRFSIVLMQTGEKIGTVEMFRREQEDEYHHFGMLRIDLQSSYETKHYIDQILDVVHNNFYEDFHVNAILTKAIPDAYVRIGCLLENGYTPIEGKLLGEYEHYYVRQK